MGKVPSPRDSYLKVKTDAKLSKTALDAIWGVAGKASMMVKKPRFTGKGKSKQLATYKDKNGVERPVACRTLRTLKKNTISTLLSAAFAEVAEITSAEGACAKLAPSGGEIKTAPALPALTKGAILLFEQAVTAYTQSVTLAALEISEGMGIHRKITVGAMAAAAGITNKRITTCGVTPTIQSIPTVWRDEPKAKPKSKKTAV